MRDPGARPPQDNRFGANDGEGQDLPPPPRPHVKPEPREPSTIASDLKRSFDQCSTLQTTLSEKTGLRQMFSRKLKRELADARTNFRELVDGLSGGNENPVFERFYREKYLVRDLIGSKRKEADWALLREKRTTNDPATLETLQQESDRLETLYNEKDAPIKVFEQHLGYARCLEFANTRDVINPMQMSGRAEREQVVLRRALALGEDLMNWARKHKDFASGDKTFEMIVSSVLKGRDWANSTVYDAIIEKTRFDLEQRETWLSRPDDDFVKQISKASREEVDVTGYISSRGYIGRFADTADMDYGTASPKEGYSINLKASTEALQALDDFLCLYGGAFSLAIPGSEENPNVWQTSTQTAYYYPSYDFAEYEHALLEALSSHLIDEPLLIGEPLVTQNASLQRSIALVEIPQREDLVNLINEASNMSYHLAFTIKNKLSYLTYPKLDATPMNFQVFKKVVDYLSGKNDSLWS